MGSMMRSIVFWPTVPGRGRPTDPGVARAVAESVDMFLNFYQRDKADRS